MIPIRVLIAEDHVLVREGLKLLLQQPHFDVVGEAGNGREAVQLAGQLKPDVAVVDISMPQLNGIDATKEIQRVSPETRTLLLTMHEGSGYLIEALRAGVTGYLLKSCAAADLTKAIQEVHRGTIYLSAGIPRSVIDEYLSRKTNAQGDPLSPRERQVLQLVAEGKRTKEVATVLGISVKTAEAHRSRIMQKLDIHETAGLVRFAIRHGVIQA